MKTIGCHSHILRLSILPYFDFLFTAEVFFFAKFFFNALDKVLVRLASRQHSSVTKLPAGAVIRDISCWFTRR